MLSFIRWGLSSEIPVEVFLRSSAWPGAADCALPHTHTVPRLPPQQGWEEAPAPAPAPAGLTRLGAGPYDRPGHAALPRSFKLLLIVCRVTVAWPVDHACTRLLKSLYLFLLHVLLWGESCSSALARPAESHTVTVWKTGGRKPVIPAGGGDLPSGDFRTLSQFAFSPSCSKHGDASVTTCFCLFVPS